MLRWLRELALLPAIGVLVRRRDRVEPGLLHDLEPEQHRAGLGGARHGRRRRDAHPADRELRPLAAVDLRARADGRRMADRARSDGHGLGTDWSPAVGILVTLAIGAAVGLFNGFMIVKLRFNAFIFTLAMLILLAGIQQGIVSGQSVYDMPPSFIVPRLGVLVRVPGLGVGDDRGLPRRRAVPALPPDGTGDLRDRRQPRGRRAPPGSRSTGSGSACSASPACWPRSAG